jgi:hypothetical protein
VGLEPIGPIRIPHSFRLLSDWSERSAESILGNSIAIDDYLSTIFDQYRLLRYIGHLPLYVHRGALIDRRRRSQSGSILFEDRSRDVICWDGLIKARKAHQTWTKSISRLAQKPTRDDIAPRRILCRDRNYRNSWTPRNTQNVREGPLQRLHGLFYRNATHHCLCLFLQ